MKPMPDDEYFLMYKSEAILMLNNTCVLLRITKKLMLNDPEIQFAKACIEGSILVNSHALSEDYVKQEIRQAAIEGGIKYELIDKVLDQFIRKVD